MRSESVDDGAEGESISPGLGHVQDVDSRIPLGHMTTPGLQSCHSRHQHPPAETERGYRH